MSRTKEKGTESKPQKAEFLPPCMLLLHFLVKEALCCVLAQGKEVTGKQSLHLWKSSSAVSRVVQTAITLLLYARTWHRLLVELLVELLSLCLSFALLVKYVRS